MITKPDDFAEIDEAFAEKPEIAPEPVEAAPEPAPEPVEAAEPTETAEEKPARTRDEHGRFAKTEGEKPAKMKAETEPKPNGKAAEIPKPPAPVTSQTPAPEPGPTSLAMKAPQAWKPQAREEWAKVPASVQAEVQRREREVDAALKESAEARKSWAQMQQTIAPYAPILQAEGLHPVSAINDALQFATAMRTAPPGHKAQMLATLVRTFGVPIDALDAALAGQPVPEGAGAPPPQMQQQNVAQLVQQQISAMAERAAQERARHELESFTSTAEFMDHEPFKRFVGLVLEDAASRGVAMTLRQAYDYAVGVHPDTAPVVRQREEAKRAATQNGATQRAKIAASSVKSSPPGIAPRATKSNPKDPAADIEEAISEVGW